MSAVGRTVAPGHPTRTCSGESRAAPVQRIGFLKGIQYLIDDRDPVFTQAFTEILKTAGVKTVQLPAKSPNLNAFEERLVRSARQECLRRVIPLGERPLRTILTEYLETTIGNEITRGSTTG